MCRNFITWKGLQQDGKSKVSVHHHLRYEFLGPCVRVVIRLNFSPFAECCKKTSAFIGGPLWLGMWQLWSSVMWTANCSIKQIPVFTHQSIRIECQKRSRSSSAITVRQPLPEKSLVTKIARVGQDRKQELLFWGEANVGHSPYASCSSGS